MRKQGFALLLLSLENFIRDFGQALEKICMFELRKYEDEGLLVFGMNGKIYYTKIVIV